MASAEQSKIEAPFDKHDLEEIYAYWPAAGWHDITLDELHELKHPASSVDNAQDHLFILRRDKNRSRHFNVNFEGRDVWGGIGFDFLNEAAYRQYSDWRNNMYFNDWWGANYDDLPIGRESTVLAKYSLAYWAHAVQDGTLTLSLHNSSKYVGNKPPYSRYDGCALMNGHEYAPLGGMAHIAKQLRDVVPALQGAFGLPKDEIAHNLESPFPHRNIWDIPGGKMLVIPENYDDKYAGVKTIRLIPDQMVDRLKAASKGAIGS